MALLHKATLAPSKLELLTDYLPTVAGLSGLVEPDIELVGSYRFDDPAGEVGIETHLVRSGSGAMLHIPLTYRNKPMPGSEADVIATIEHSVLGTRWVYNAVADPVYVSELLTAILTGGRQVEQYFEGPEGRTYRDPSAVVAGTGSPGSPVPTVGATSNLATGTESVIAVGDIELVVRHALDEPAPSDTNLLSGTWAGLEDRVVLAYIR